MTLSTSCFTSINIERQCELFCKTMLNPWIRICCRKTVASFALQMVHNVILTKLRAFSDFLEFAEQQKCKMVLFCSIYGQTTLTLQISLQTLWGKGFSGDLSFCPATPTQRLFKLHFYRDSGRTCCIQQVFCINISALHKSWKPDWKGLHFCKRQAEVDQGQDRRDQIGFGGGVGPL